jgi:hypothetical protein
MVVDLLCLAFPAKPTLTKAATAALAATALRTPAKAPMSVARLAKLCYNWHPQLTCMNALFVVVQQRVRQGSSAAAAGVDLKRLLLEWLDVFCAGECGCLLTPLHPCALQFTAC